MHLAFALPTPDRTGGGGGADYVDGLAGGLRELGAAVDVLRGDDPSFPAGATPVVDGMLLPLLHDRLSELLRADAVVLVHHVAAASGRDAETTARIRAVEQDMLPKFRRIVATSEPVAERLAETFGVSAHALLPGARPVTPATPDPAAPVILSVGVLTRRKGHDKLIRVVTGLLDLPWQLVILGDTQRDPDHPAELRRLVAELGLAERVVLQPDPTADTLDAAWQRATVFALATRWEGYPTAVADSLGRGVPVLVTSGANASGILPPTAGLIAPLDDMATFGKCLRRLLFDDALRHDLADGARRAGQALPSWAGRARDFIALLEQPS